MPLGCGVVADAPSLDVAWAADLEDAQALPLGSFEGAALAQLRGERFLARARRLLFSYFPFLFLSFFIAF